MVHELKIEEKYFDDILSLNKTFEIRKKDRNYSVGDYLGLNEIAISLSKERYTGRSAIAKLTYILDDSNFCKKNYVVLGIKILPDTVNLDIFF